VRAERSRPGAGRLRRRTDCVEDAVAWLLTALGLLTTVLALASGARSYAEGMDRVRAERGDRVRIEAVLLEAAPMSVVLSPMGQSWRPPRVPVAARYTTVDGVEHVVDVWVTGPPPAGTPVPVWVDRAGAVTTDPPGRAEAAVGAALRVVVIVVPGVLVLGVTWALVRVRVRRDALARWGREWSEVEPKWSGRSAP
jgi:hypothetical protein